MAVSFSHITLVGNLGADPRVNETPDGKRVANFRIAVKSSYQRDAPADWYDVEVWGKQVDFVEQYLKKGSNVLVDGQPTQKRFTGRDGVEKVNFGVRANSVLNNTPRQNTDEALDDLPV